MQEHMRTYGSVVAIYNVYSDFMRHWASGTRKVYYYDGWAKWKGAWAVLRALLRTGC